METKEERREGVTNNNTLANGPSETDQNKLGFGAEKCRPSYTYIVSVRDIFDSVSVDSVLRAR